MYNYEIAEANDTMPGVGEKIDCGNRSDAANGKRPKSAD